MKAAAELNDLETKEDILLSDSHEASRTFPSLTVSSRRKLARKAMTDYSQVVSQIYHPMKTKH